MNQTMAKLQGMSESEQSIFIRVLFGHSTPSLVSQDQARTPTLAT